MSEKLKVTTPSKTTLPASDAPGKTTKIDLSDLYGENGGKVFEAPTPEQSDAESVENENEARE